MLSFETLQMCSAYVWPNKVTNYSSCVIITSWNESCFFLDSIISIKAFASPSMLSASKLVVGSSSARMPQEEQKVSARDSLMMIELKTF